MEIGKYKCSYIEGTFYVTFVLKVRSRVFGINYWKTVYRGAGYDDSVHARTIPELGLDWLEAKYKRIIENHERLVESNKDWTRRRGEMLK